MKDVNFLQLALDILRGRWLISGAEAFMPHALDFLAHLPYTGQLQGTDIRMSSYSGDDDLRQDKEDKRQVAIIPIHGVMTKYGSCYTYGSIELAAEIASGAEDENVAGIVLDIDSPGGAVNSVPPILEAVRKVRAKGKPIIAHCDSCCSAAYWVASQCDAVFMDNTLSEAGSIGAYCTFIDDRENKLTGEKVVSIYARESGDKNKAYREALEGRYELCQDELSDIVGEFHNAVKSGRPGLKADAAGVLTGAVFTSGKAVANGLADGVKTLAECVDNVFIRSEYQ